MTNLFKLVYFWILMRSSSCWLVPHETERRGNSIPPPAMAKQVSNECRTVAACMNDLKSHPSNVNRLAFTLMGQGIDGLVISSKLQNTLIDAAGSFYPYTSHLIELYSTMDGIHYTDGEHSLQELWLFPNYYFLSLEEAVEIYQDFPRDTLRNPTLYPEIDEYRSQEIEDFDFVWFPIMASGIGEYIFLDLSTGKIFDYVPTFSQYGESDDEEENEAISFSTILAFLKDILQHFKSGKYHVRNGIVFESNNDAFQVETVIHLVDSPTANNDDNNDVTGNKYHMEGHPIPSGDPSDSSRRVTRIAQKLHNRHGMPLLNLNCRGMGMICNFLEHSINDHGSQRTVCKVKKIAHIRESNRNICGPVKRTRGSDCNQFPFASMQHTSAHASERRASLVPTVELNVLGGQIRAFHRAMELSTKPRKRCFKVATP